MLKRIFVVPALAGGVFLSAVSAGAQEVEMERLTFKELQERLAKESPYYWHATGEKPDEFKVELKLNFKLDRSTPEKCVESWNALTDERETARWTSGAIGHYMDRVLRRGMRPFEEKLLTTELIEPMDNTHFADNHYFSWGQSDRSFKPAEIDRTVKLENGSVHVFTSQSLRTAIRSHRFNREEGGMRWYDEEVEFTTIRKRLTCKQDRYGNWVISSIEVEVAEGETTAWQNDRNPLRTAVAFVKCANELDEPEVLERDTPEKAALSVFTHLGRRWRATRRGMQAKIWSVYLEKQRLLTTEQMYDEADKQTQEPWGIKALPEWEATFTRDDGTIEVRFKKPEVEWEPAQAVIVRRKGAGYEVVECGTFYVFNNDTEPTYMASFVYDWAFP